jgi:hypothetical protein
LIKYLLTYNTPVFWIIIHLILGLSAVFSPFPLIVWFYFALFSSLIIVIRPGAPVSIYISMIVYLIAFEIIARMSGASPYIPYEMGKYLLFVLLVLGILKYKVTEWPALWMALVLLPGILLDLSGEVSFLDMIFNFLGPLNAALAILFFKGKRISRNILLECLRFMIYPMIAVLAFAFFRTPDIEDVEFGLSANSAVAGGFGSNQVSTGLGLASFFVFIFWINRWKLSGYRWLDTFLLAVFTIQGLLTFSRGGMMTGFLGVFIVIYYLRSASKSQINKYRLAQIGKYLLPAFLIIGSAFFLVNRLTNGMLLLRYQGETSGTFAGTKDKDLNTITSGRLDIFVGDFELWLDHPVFGVGVGASRYMRDKMKGVVAHVEVSRLISEHGLLGIVYFLILLFYGWKLLRTHPNPSILGILVAFFAVGLFTSFHAAMRTFVSPLMIGLSMLTITDKVFKPSVKSISERINNNETLVKL